MFEKLRNQQIRTQWPTEFQHIRQQGCCQHNDAASLTTRAAFTMTYSLNRLNTNHLNIYNTTPLSLEEAINRVISLRCSFWRHRRCATVVLAKGRSRSRQRRSTEESCCTVEHPRIWPIHLNHQQSQAQISYCLSPLIPWSLALFYSLYHHILNLFYYGKDYIHVID